MKLRNKKTGGLANILGEQDFIRVYTDEGWEVYKSIAELSEEWEDYEPKEPLVGDEDERELVSKWASLYVITKVIARKRKTSPTIELLDFDEKDRILAIDAYTTITDGIYTIEELCGEGEE